MRCAICKSEVLIAEDNPKVFVGHAEGCPATELRNLAEEVKGLDYHSRFYIDRNRIADEIAKLLTDPQP